MRLQALFGSGALMLLFSGVAMPVSTSYQEFQDAVRATPDVERGAQYFATCAGCHGAKGQGQVDGKFPRIGGQHFGVIVRQLVAFRHDQRWDILMENFAGQHRLPDAQALADVAQYVSELDVSSPAGTGGGELVMQGARVYFRLCESCHGPTGQGDPNDMIPRIGGQHYEYLRRQIYDAVDGRRPGFPASHIRLLARLEHDDIAGVADYLSRMLNEPTNPRMLPTDAH